MDRFSFFFAFYGLLLGLAVAELLGGFARMVRAKAVRKLEAQTALTALLIFLLLCATWIEAFDSFRDVALDFDGLWAPILIATSYFLAATVVFPSDEADYDRLADYFAGRKPFIIGMLFAAECFLNISFLPEYGAILRDRPALFWLFLMPFNLAINLTWLGLVLAKGRVLVIGLLAFQIILFIVLFWSQGAASSFVDETFGDLWPR